MSAIALTFALAALTSLHTIEDLKDRAVDLNNAGRPITIAALMPAFGPFDVAVLAMLILCGLWLIALEWRHRSLSRLLSEPREPEIIAVLVVVSAWLGHAYWSPGVLLGGDSGTHIARYLEMARGLESGTIASWTNYNYLGSSLLGFTGPLTYLIGGAVAFLVKDAVLTAKILLFAAHLAAAFVFYLYCRRLGFGSVAALLSTILFAGSFAHLHLFLYRGVFPQAFTILLLVLLFFAAEGLARGARYLSTDWAIFALATAGLIVNHQPHALFAAAYLALFGGASLALGRWQWAGLLPMASAGLAGVVVSLAAVIPIIAESSWVMIEPEGGFFQFHLPTPERLLRLVIWRNTRSNWARDYWAYIGLALAALTVYGGVTALSRRLGRGASRLAAALLPCAVLCLFMSNPVVRDIIFLLFFAALLAAFGIEKLMIYAERAPWLAVALLVFILLDVSSTSIQPLGRSDKQFMIDAGIYLERIAPDQRVVEVAVDQQGALEAALGPFSTPISYYSTVQRIAGHHNMAATRVHNYAISAVKLAEGDLTRDGRLSPPSETLLAMLNVGRIICFTPARAGCPPALRDGVDEPPLGRVVRLSAASPVLFSRRLVRLPPEDGLDKPMLWKESFEEAWPQVASVEAFLSRFLEAGGFDLPGRSAVALPVRSLRKDAAPPADPALWHPVLKSYAVGLERVRFSIETDAPGFVQLAHPWFPSTAVRDNGRPVEALESAIGLMVVPIEPGLNEIELAPTTTPIRRATLAVSLAALLVVIIAWVAAASRRPAPGGH